MALTAQSSLADVQAAYDDNADYAEVASVTKAKAFVTACRILLRRLPRAAGAGASRVDLSPELIRAEMDAAQQFVNANDTATNGGVSHFSFENFRD